ncbi:MAG TPA: LPXTG cell wall anchor domain-containing protein, partial [Candidatus Sulfotelmatobacter sp.]|nr:LPXTG cell wall anchor domain-containing protein [Candidatus Sulfotelmatobacter sp.]
STDQNAASPSASTPSTTADQNATAPDKAPADQNAAPADKNANAGQNLPQTASPLPLLGLLGLGSLVTGLISRRKK